MLHLEYESEIFLDAFHDDGLLILSKGLGIERFLFSFLKLYSDPGQLVLVLNVSPEEQEYLIDELDEAGVKPTPKVITNEVGTNERHAVYLQGGVLFVTSRILVVDMLTERIPINLITGILVYKAHKLIESCQEAFILRLYRQKNKTGFVKAFSDSPQSFTSGFCQVERIMRNLFVKKLFLWPRFQANIVAFMEKHKPEVVELHLTMTPAMQAIQMSLLDLLSVCLKELKQCNPSLDTDELSVENAITKSFTKIVKFQLDPVWQQLSPKTRQLVSDLKTLRLILIYLTQYDCVTFYNLIHSIRRSESQFGNVSTWMLLDSAESLYVHAKERIYGSDDKPNRKKKSKETSTEESNLSEPVFEDNPKWLALTEILKEVETENLTADPSLGPGNVLIVADDDRTCSQIKEVLTCGGKSLLIKLYKKRNDVKSEESTIGSADALPKIKSDGDHFIKRKQSNKTKGISGDETSTSEEGLDKHTKIEKDLLDQKSLDDKLVSADAYFEVLTSPLTILHPLHGTSKPFNLLQTLNEVQPRYIIMYDADMAFVRRIEIFKASRPDIPLRVYFLVYSGTVEEQRYLTTLRKENEAFEYLIKEKASMVVVENQDGRSENDPDSNWDTSKITEGISTRQGGLDHETKVKQKVIVDMREFRSELPSLIHRRGIDIDPVTLEVGDYILTPDICVERKSLNDLISSLNSGRLYNQALSMVRHYKRPVLLIEFDQNKSFSLQNNYYMNKEVSFQDVSSKLTLLTLHFPRLKILWCSSPYATAELFQEIKIGKPQPDSTVAVSITGETSVELPLDRYNHIPQDFLLKLPGINAKNYQVMMNKVNNLVALSKLSEDEINIILGNSVNAKALWQFLHSEQQPSRKVLTKLRPFKGFKKKR